MLLANTVNVLLSAKLWAWTVSIAKQKSLKKQANRVAPTIDSCGTPEITFRKLL